MKLLTLEVISRVVKLSFLLQMSSVTLLPVVTVNSYTAYCLATTNRCVLTATVLPQCRHQHTHSLHHSVYRTMTKGKMRVWFKSKTQ